MFAEMRLLDALGLNRVTPNQRLDIAAHPFIDQRKQVGARRIQRIVEIEDPAIDMIKRWWHPAPLTIAMGRRKFVNQTAMRGLVKR